jgi:hypothetical protein
MIKPSCRYLVPFATAALLLSVAFAASPSLTIYNQNFAVVRDAVPLDLKAGINEARFSGMTAMAETDSVILRDHKKEAVEIRVVEHLSRFDNWEIKEKSNDLQSSLHLVSLW